MRDEPVTIVVDGCNVVVPARLGPLGIMEAAGLDPGKHTLSEVKSSYSSVLQPSVELRLIDGQVFVSTAQFEAWRRAC